MATTIDKRTRGPLAADRMERFLAIGSALMLACVLVALGRGHADWGRVPPLIWAHLATIGVALALTPFILLRPRGDATHRLLGRVWAGAMLATALISFGISTSRPGHFSPIHILSLFVAIQVPRVVFAARRHQIDRHRGGIRGLVIGALLIAGFFTFPFDRLLGHWLFS